MKRGTRCLFWQFQIDLQFVLTTLPCFFPCSPAFLMQPLSWFWYPICTFAEPLPPHLSVKLMLHGSSVLPSQQTHGQGIIENAPGLWRVMLCLSAHIDSHKESIRGTGEVILQMCVEFVHFFIKVQFKLSYCSCTTKNINSQYFSFNNKNAISAQ